MMLYRVTMVGMSLTSTVLSHTLTSMGDQHNMVDLRGSRNPVPAISCLANFRRGNWGRDKFDFQEMTWLQPSPDLMGGRYLTPLSYIPHLT